MEKIIHFGNKKLEYYKDILIRADSGLHAQVASEIKRRMPEGAKILDLGAGQGAMSLRLKDLGYQVVASDVDREDFKVGSEVDFHELDMNEESAVSSFQKEYKDHFDGLISLEVIEHVENPWSLVRFIHSVLKPGGYAFITTPNITSWLSRWFFLRTGRFHQFLKKDLEYGHVSPISSSSLNYILEKSGFAEISTLPGGTLPPIYLTKSIDLLFGNLLMLLFRPFSRGIKDGWSIICIARKKS
jgi:SAM-dependent methyltransferase